MKSATFPATGRATASYMTPGAQLTGSAIRMNERVISIDNLLVSDVFVAEIDEAMNHFDVRGEYAYQLGAALAREADKTLFIVGYLGARQTAGNITGSEGTGSGGSQAHSNSHTDATQLATAAAAAAEHMDERDVPKNDRFIALAPAQYHLAAQYTNFLNRDWGGEGSYARAQVPFISGFEVVESNNLPTTNIASSPSGANNTYHGDFTNNVALCWHRSAIGTASLIGLAVEREYLIQNQGTLMVAKYAMGHDWLRPEGLYEIKHSL